MLTVAMRTVYIFIIYSIALNLLCIVFKYFYRKARQLIFYVSATSNGYRVVDFYNGPNEVDDSFDSRNDDVKTERWLMDFVPERDINFLLYTNKNPTEAQKIVLNDSASLLNSSFNSKEQIR